jgi:hypothetical protein
LSPSHQIGAERIQVALSTNLKDIFEVGTDFLAVKVPAPKE